MPNNFFWYDVMTTDTKAAEAFYADVVGWGTMDAGAADAQYTLFTVSGTGVAGLMPVPKDAPGMHPSWFGYIHVDDVDATAQRIKAEGGAIYREPFEVPGVIRIAVAADPQGAGFLIAKPLRAEAKPDMPTGTPGTVGWRELYAGDWTTVFPFYEKLFGWTKAEAAIDMGPMGAYQMFAAGAQPVGGMMTKRPHVPGPPRWNYYIHVQSVEAAVARITEGGGQVLLPPTQVPGGQWVIQALDPQKTFFALVSTQK